MKIFPYKVFYLKTKKKFPLFTNQVLFSVAKGYVRSAVRRNKIKRLGREAYRLHMHILQEALNDDVAFLIGFVYTGPCSLVVHNNTLTNAVITSLQHLKVLISMSKVVVVQ